MVNVTLELLISKSYKFISVKLPKGCCMGRLHHQKDTNLCSAELRFPISATDQQKFSTYMSVF